MADPLMVVEGWADWSAWVPFDQVATAPRLPGVYLAREGADGPVVYVGMAGERTGGGRPKGLYGRLNVYASGKGIVSGLGEAAADRAFADAEWLRARLAEVEQGEPSRALEWGRAAMARAGLYVKWAVTDDKATAVELEERIITVLAGAGLWNRGRRTALFKLPS